MRVCQILEMSLRKQEDFLHGKLWRCCRIEEIQLVQKTSKVAESENTRIREVGETMWITTEVYDAAQKSRNSI